MKLWLALKQFLRAQAIGPDPTLTTANAQLFKLLTDPRMARAIKARKREKGDVA